MKLFSVPFSFFLFLFTNAQQPRLVLPIGHTGRIQSAAYSPDMKYIVTAAEDKTAKIWSAMTGLLLMEFQYPDIVNSAIYSPDGKYIAVSWGENIFTLTILDAYTGKKIIEGKNSFLAVFSPDSKYLVTATINYASTWNITTGKLLKELPGLIDMTASMSYSPDGKYILVSGKDHSRLYDAARGEIAREIDGGEAGFSPDGKFILTTQNRVSKLWNAADGKLIREINGFSGKFDPGGKYITSISNDPSEGLGVNITAAADGKLLNRLKGFEESIRSVHFSPACPDDPIGGKYIITASTDPLIRIWNSKDGSLFRSADPGDYIHTAIFSPDGKYYIVATEIDCKIWNTTSGQLHQELKGYTSYVRRAEFSPACPGDPIGGKYMVTASGQDKSARIWDLNSGKPLIRLKGHTGSVYAASYSPDGKYIVTASADHTARIWNASNGELIHILSEHTSIVYDARYSPDGKYIATASHDKKVVIWDAVNGELVSIINGELFQSVFFDPTGKFLLTTDYDSYVINWSIADGKMIWKTRGYLKFMGNAVFSPDGKTVLSASRRDAAELLNVTDGKQVVVFDWHDDGVNWVGFSPDNQYVVTASSDNSARIWEAKTGKQIKRMDGHINALTSAMFNPAGNRLVTSSADNTTKIWATATGNLQATFIAVNENDYFTQIPSGYYQSSTNAARLLHYVTKDLQVISFEQLDVKYNRPDKVLEALGNGDTLLIRSYRKAWEKRIRKLGIDTMAFRDGYSVPQADFANRSAVSYEQKKERVTLRIKGNDSSYKLDRFNVWVNEVPVYGQRGISLRKRNRNSFDTTITLALSQGENRIETSISNVNGTSSYRMPLVVNYTPDVKQKEMTRFIGIGIDHFADATYNLQYSAKDIRDLALKLKEKYGNTISIDTLFNEKVTVNNVKALKKKLLQTTSNDKVIVAYSGHGMLSKEYDYYLSTYTVNFDKPEIKGLPYDELENLLDSIPARKKLMLIDACHSGEVDKDELVRINQVADSLKLKKGLKPVKYKDDVDHLGLKNSFELMQSLFVNVGKSTGATIISAAAGTQFALERNDLKNGVFTFSILEAMNKFPSIKISELKKIVGERVVQLTNGLQKPTSRNETIAVDWDVW